jgi:hypothetical protein
METKIFMQDEQIEVTLDEWRSRSINSKCDEIRIEGRPIVKSDGSQTIMKLTLRIERMELCHVLHPSAPVDQRPVMGFCTCKPLQGGKIYCTYRKSTGECTSNPEDTGTECEHKCHETFCLGNPEKYDMNHASMDCTQCMQYKNYKRGI